MFKKISLLMAALLSLDAFSADFLEVFKKAEQRNNSRKNAELNTNNRLSTVSSNPERKRKINMLQQSIDYLLLIDSEWIGDALPSFGFNKSEFNTIVVSNKEFSKLLRQFNSFQERNFDGEKVISISVFTNGSSQAENFEVTRDNIFGFTIQSYILNGKGMYSHRTYILNKDTASFEPFLPYTTVIPGHTGCSAAPLLSMRLAQNSNTDTMHVSSSIFIPRMLDDSYLQGRVSVDVSISNRLEMENIRHDQQIVN